MPERRDGQMTLAAILRRIDPLRGPPIAVA
jgi:hypothetical protein